MAKKAIWDKPNPKRNHKTLSPAQKAKAKRLAKRAGRPYPNMVDNARVARGASGGAAKRKTAAKKSVTKKTSARKSTRKSSTRKSSTRKTSARKSPARKTVKKSAKRSAKKSARRSGSRTGRARPDAPTKDPHGGLTAAGRRAFAARDGSHLRPGVKKSAADMSPAEMKRKGSWARRFYGRAKLPALVDGKGEPTRFALGAAAWGEPVPRTEAAARRIAAWGEALLERYRRLAEKPARKSSGKRTVPKRASR